MRALGRRPGVAVGLVGVRGFVVGLVGVRGFVVGLVGLVVLIALLGGRRRRGRGLEHDVPGEDRGGGQAEDDDRDEDAAEPAGNEIHDAVASVLGWYPQK